MPVRGSHHSSREESGTVREQTLRHKHASVLLKEAVEALAIKKGDLVLDATVGLGGHSEALHKAGGTVIALDADSEAVAATKARLPQVRVIEGNFGDLPRILVHEHIPVLDKVLFDLGWNSTQLFSGRGFSFLNDEPLSMSYGKKPASGFNAAEILNTWEEKVLADIFFGYGEERYARPIAKAIVERRKIKRIETTLELVEIIKDAVPARYRHGRLHPATKTFQALRIAVNDELKSIERGVSAAWKYLSCEGRIAVVTFHSIEDRLVKRMFAHYAKQKGAAHGHIIFKKPLIPRREEIGLNPSARSAKLRAIEKICIKQ